MPNKSSVRYEAPDQLDDTSDLRDDLQRDLQEIFSTKNPLAVLPMLSGLLVAKWASHEEFKRETAAISKRRAFKSVLPEALRLRAWGHEPKRHAKAINEALRKTNRQNGQGIDPRRYGCKRYVDLVKPSIIRANFNKETQSRFEKLLSWVRRIDFAAPEVREIAAELFDDRLRLLVEKKGEAIGKFITPEPVAELMLNLANPKEDDSIYDPCFGWGGLLVRAARRISSAERSNIFGFECDQDSFAIGLCRMLLAGVDLPLINNEDALRSTWTAWIDGTKKNRFDCILAVPPWKFEDNQRSRYQSAEKFLWHVMEKLNPDGRAVIALPQRMLHDNMFQKVRMELLWSYRVDAVVSLPRGAFRPFYPGPGSLLVFRRHPSPPVHFVKVLPDAWKSSPPSVADVIGHRMGAVPLGLEVWNVPVRDLPMNYGLLTEKPGTERLNDVLNRIKKLKPSLELKPLYEVAFILSGIKYDDSFTTKDPNGSAVVAGLLNVADVRMGAKSPSMFLTGKGKNQLSEGDKSRLDKIILRADDIVVTTVGEIGLVGLISADTEMVGALPNKNMVLVRVRNKKKILSQFLAVLLRSPAYQEELRRRNQEFKYLPIPIPDESTQKKTISEMEGVGGDALAVLDRLLSGTKNDPVARWLENPFVAQLAARGGTHALAGTEALTSAAKELLSLAKSKVGDQQISEWIRIAHRGAVVLEGLTSIPRARGTGRLAIIGVALSRLHEALRTLDKVEGPTGDRLRSFTQAIIELSEKEVNAIEESITLDISVEPTEVPVRTTSEVQLRLTNSSTASLRLLTVKTEPSVGSEEIPYLAEGETFEVPLTVHPEYHEYADRKPFPIGVSWQAYCLDGTIVRGEEKRSLRVMFTAEAERFGTLKTGDLGPSPYIVGNPVDQVEMFFGRTKVMDQIRRHLGGTDHANVLLLEGNRRTGKTSILHQLEKPDTLPGWIPVYCSLQGTEGDDKTVGFTTKDFFRKLTLDTGKTLYRAGVKTWLSSLPEPTPELTADRFRWTLAFRKALDQAFSNEYDFETFESYISSAIEAAKPNRILLMLDEFDKLQEGIDSGITSPQVPENIRYLLQNSPGLSAIITGSRRLKKLREEYWSVLFGIGSRIPISELPIEGARQLVTEPVKGRLQYLPQARDYLVELCACQPFLVQSLCSRVFELAADSEGPRTITRDIVEEAATKMVEDNEHFHTLWDYARTARRKLILLLCEATATMDLNQLNVKLHQFGVSFYQEDDLNDDITELLELELIDRENSDHGRTYRLSVPLMGRWLQLHQNIDEVAMLAKKEVEAKP